jgi:acyl carrier protein phosphodiesterase
MNYLVHLYLSDADPLCRIGNLMGDFVKGRLDRYDFPERVAAGLRQHRAVDTLSMHHAAVRRSKAHLDDRFGHTKGILIDIFYDHLLSRNWDTWAHGTLKAFAEDGYKLLKRHRNLLPDAFRPVARRIIRYDWLTAYRTPKTIKFVLEQMAARLSRPNLLAQGYTELARCGEAMETDCRDFLSAAAKMLANDTGADPKPKKSLR